MGPFIYTEITPNPATLKFVVGGAALARAPVDLEGPAAAARSPLGRRIFGVPGVERVFIGPAFVSVTKSASADWDSIAPLVEEVIRAHLASGEPAVEDAAPAPPAAGGAEDEVSRRIRRILDEEIRPAVAMDGGDIRFVSYRDGVVTLHLQGACHACPSATMTLRMGVENRLRASIPEIREVVQV